MDVFISWSGVRSKAVAQALEWWLRLVINAVEPWISSDIDKGRRWGDEISTRLGQSKVGIICLTTDNLEEKWIHFEAGALSKTKDAHVCTLLLDIKNENDVEYPLAQFQHTKAQKDEIYGLVKTINKLVEKCGEKSLPEKLLSVAFDTYWPGLEQKLKEALLLPSATTKVERSEGEMLQEILQLVRDQDRRLDQLMRPPGTVNVEAASMAELINEYKRLGLMRIGNVTTIADFVSATRRGHPSSSRTANAATQMTQDPLDVGPSAPDEKAD